MTYEQLFYIFCTFNVMSLPFVIVSLFISNNVAGLVLSKLFRILKTSIISLIVHLWSGNMSNCFNRSLYDKLLNVGICFATHLCILLCKFWSLM